MKQAKPVVVIVAGGLATRMRPITEEIPKCLVDINGKPLIQHQIEFFKSKGYVRFIFCVAHLAEKVKEHFGDGSRFGVSISYVQETEELMGTAGSVKLIAPLVSSEKDLIVYYGDNITSMDFDKFMEFHARKNALATVCVRPLPPGYKSSSIITLDGQKKISCFLEHPAPDEIPQDLPDERYINSGIYALSTKALEIIPAGKKRDFAKQLFPEMIAKKMSIYGYPTTEFFREIGRTEKYLAFLEEVKGKSDIFGEPLGESPRRLRKAVFLDRDGVINRNVKDLVKPEQFELLPGVGGAIKKLNDTGYLVVVVTNQPIIAKGFMTFKDLERIHEKMVSELRKFGAKIDGIFTCPHHPEKGFPGEVPELKIACDCRKPKPGLILDASKKHGIDLSQSWMIGDSNEDVLAGIGAGAKTIFLASGGGSGRKDAGELKQTKPTHSAHSLAEAVNIILAHH